MKYDIFDLFENDTLYVFDVQSYQLGIDYDNLKIVKPHLMKRMTLIRRVNHRKCFVKLKTFPGTLVKDKSGRIKFCRLCDGYQLLIKPCYIFSWNVLDEEKLLSFYKNNNSLRMIT